MFDKIFMCCGNIYFSILGGRLTTIHRYFGEQNARHMVQCKMVEVQKQKATKDCGVFAVAFLTSLAYNQDPTDGLVQYYQDQL